MKKILKWTGFVVAAILFTSVVMAIIDGFRNMNQVPEPQAVTVTAPDELIDDEKRIEDANTYIYAGISEINNFVDSLVGKNIPADRREITRLAQRIYDLENKLNVINYDPEDKNRGAIDSTKKKFNRFLNKSLPAMREGYAIVLAQDFWEDDIYITAHGQQKDRLVICGAVFSINKNIRSFHDKYISYPSFLLKFKKVNYGWYKGQTEELEELQPGG